MKATAPPLAALAVLLLLAPLAQAQCYYPIPQAPDACGPGFYSANCCGQPYGPNYYVYPPYPPFQGMVFGPQNQGGGPGGPGAGPGGGPGGLFGQPSFATHPFARSPRDFFMVYQNTQVPYR